MTSGVSSLEKDVTDIRSRLTTKEAEIAALSAQVATLSGHIMQLLTERAAASSPAPAPPACGGEAVPSAKGRGGAASVIARTICSERWSWPGVGPGNVELPNFGAIVVDVPTDSWVTVTFLGHYNRGVDHAYISFKLDDEFPTRDNPEWGPSSPYGAWHLPGPKGPGWVPISFSQSFRVAAGTHRLRLWALRANGAVQINGAAVYLTIAPLASP
jgi:hypothetical protein